MAVDHVYSPSVKRHYFACRLESVLVPALDADLTDRLRRRVEFVTSLMGGSPGLRAYDLRLISSPDPDVPVRGRITVALLGRLDETSADDAGRDAAEVLGLLRAFFDEFTFVLTPASDLPHLLEPAPMRHQVALARRCGWQTLVSSGNGTRRKHPVGFENGRVSSPAPAAKNAVLHFFPFVASAWPANPLVTLLLQHPVPIVVSAQLRPTTLTAEEETWLAGQIGRSERHAQASLGPVPDDLSALRPTLREQARLCERYQSRLLLALQAQAALVTNVIGSPEPIPDAVVHAVGATLTAPAGAVGATPETAALAGGYATLALDADAARALASLDLVLPTASPVPAEAGRLRYLCNALEAAASFHLPILTRDGCTGLDVQRWRERAPVCPLSDRGTTIGVAGSGRSTEPVCLDRPSRLQHTYVVGQTGVGKTTVLKTMILDDIEAGEGVCVIDPHGDLYRDILEQIPARRLEDVVLVDPTDSGFPVGLNLLEYETVSECHFLIQELVDIIFKLIEDEFGADTLGHFVGPVFLQHMRMNLLLTMSNPEDPGTLVEFVTIYQQEGYWKRWVPLQLQDPQLERWVTRVLPETNYLVQSSDGSSMGSYVGSKFENFVFDPRLRNIFGQKRSTVNLRGIMDAGKILLVNLAKGALTEANARFLGMLLLAKLQAVASRRCAIPPAERRPFYVYVDEFQSMATQNFISLLSEGRKFGVGLTLANQFISQIRDRRIVDAIFGNVGTLICFRLGPVDAELIEKELFPAADRADLLNLPNWQAYVKLFVDGQAAHTLSVHTKVPPYCPDAEQALRIRAWSRSRYGRPRHAVEADIARSLEPPNEE